MFCGTRDLLMPGCRLLARRAAEARWDLTYVEEPGLIREWLDQRDRVNAALADTQNELRGRRRGLSRGVATAIGSAALIGVAAVALGFLLARRKR